MLALPSSQKKITEGLDEARANIEGRLARSGPGIVRNLELPAHGHSTEWILEEMGRMDAALAGHTDWRDGKVSGAVYRTHSFTLAILETRVSDDAQMAAMRWKRSL